jgi:hypothetical protein
MDSKETHRTSSILSTTHLLLPENLNLASVIKSHETAPAISHPHRTRARVHYLLKLPVASMKKIAWRGVVNNALSMNVGTIFSRSVANIWSYGKLR